MAKAPLNLLGDSFAVSHFERICSAEGLTREKMGIREGRDQTRDAAKWRTKKGPFLPRKTAL
jgi:hypothetical protein